MTRKIFINLIYLWLLLINFQYLFTKTFPILPLWTIWIDDLLIYLSFGLSLIKVKNNFKPSINNISLNRTFIYFIIVSIISASVNLVLLSLGFFLSLRFFLQPILIFYVLCKWNLNNNTIFSLIKFQYILILIQVPFVLLQAITYPELNFSDAQFYDSQYGFFGYGAANLLGLLLLLPLFILILKLKFDSSYIRVKLILPIILITIAIFLTFSKIAYLMLFLGLLIIYSYSNIYNRFFLRNIWKAIFVLIIPFAILTYISNNTSGGVVKNDSQSIVTKKGFIRNIENQFDEDGSGRFYMFININNEIVNSATSFTFGFGPGNYCSNAGFIVENERISKWIRFFGSRSTRFDMDVMALLSEYGYLGTILYLLLYIITLINILKKNRLIEDHNNLIKRYRIYTLAVSVWGIIIIVSSFTNAVFQTVWISTPFWFMSALIYKLQDNLLQSKISTEKIS